MKANNKQIEICDAIITQMNFFKSSNDINSPTNLSDIDEEINKLDIDEDKANILINAIQDIYYTIINIE